ncbi:response regulator transcription factor [Cohnella hashimotonis]|uniref:Response regulator n=1 Tax=Cohnella hashimotonis TaxID=2826895 RepID=A0ABT6TFT3_9BACL|nr:response regulator [Cohnella hashimotonis]MDI4645158.1 response regulator [Cohnella hashimotonis]
MLKLLLVEDELRIRKGLIHAVRWDRLGIEVCQAAGDGREALAAARQHHPDLVLTDIRMPGMDGLEFIRELRGSGSDAVVVVISGYNDFDYAREAMRLQVTEYILKPSRPAEIEQVMLRAVTKLAEIRKDRALTQSLQSAVHRSVPLLRSQTLRQWIEHPRMPGENRESLAGSLQLPFAGGAFHVGLIRIHGADVRRLQYAEGEVELLRYAALNIASELLGAFCEGKSEALQHGNDIVWVAQPPKLEADKLRLALSHLMDRIRELLKLSVSISAGDPVDSLDDLRISYEQAYERLESRMLENDGKVFLAEVQSGESQSSDSEELRLQQDISRLETRMLNLLQEDKMADVLDTKDEWLEAVRRLGQGDRIAIQGGTAAFLTSLRDRIALSPADSPDWRSPFALWLHQSSRVDSYEQLSQLMTEIVQSLARQLQARRPLHRTIASVLSMIESRYSENLTLEGLAKEAYVSTNYLSTLFKQELGINFLDYLHQYRIEAAKKLLAAEPLRIFAVASLVGYQDERYFTQMFKKWTGLTPSQYQKNMERTQL